MDQGVIRNLKTIYRRNLLLKLVEEGYDDLHSFWENLSVLDAIYYVDTAWKLVKSSTVKKSWREMLLDEENEIPTDDDDSPHLQRKILEDLRKLDCSENVDEQAMEQWINEDSTLECCEVLVEDDIVSRVTCGSEETRNFEECPESDEENLVTHQQLSHGDTLVHTEALRNYLEQEDESTPIEKIILKILHSIIRRRINEKQEQTSIISFFTKQ
ncbi:Tigger transposable element-derived protein 2 [Araneus ventricosus]|uniref:Tigger transposable element-derived protein 2 n=1 Tax=Araneus ventricosus TaxID=182803 RepID=A0A4Y2G0U8_ARAVE|nr:Tigger transposable element-derived protein 2 [Araneus ventricosus]